MEKIKFQRQNLIEVQNAKEDLIILNSEQAKNVDAKIIELGTDGFELMQRAASAAMQAIFIRCPHSNNFSIFCGSGNNGGDGLVLAYLLKKAGKKVRCILVGGNKFVGEAKEAWELVENELDFVQLQNWQALENSGEEVLVDALFGIGLNKKPTGAYAQAIEKINESKWTVCALDLPSGINSQNGEIYEDSVKADLTICFLALKKGLLSTAAKNITGRIYLADLGFKAENFLDISASASLRDKVYLACANSLKLTERSDLAHKGNNGKLLIIGGDVGTAGAVGLCAQAALRSGAGLVKVLTPKENANWLLARSPELVLSHTNSKTEILDLLTECDALVIGTGLGQKEWGRNLLQIVVENYKGICVADADALNILSEGNIKLNSDFYKNLCITPHPKEAGRLLKTSVEKIEENRFLSCEKLLQFSAYGILKGADSLIYSKQKIYFSNFGNGGMATAGMGDLLAGIIGALLAQGFSIEKASLVGALSHAKSGDAAARKIGKRGLIASDLLKYIPSFLN